MKRFAFATPMMDQPKGGSDRMCLVFLCDGWKRYMRPARLSHYVTRQVIFMQPLHDEDDSASTLVIKSSDRALREPIVRELPPQVGTRLLRFCRIIDDQIIGPEAVQRPAHRRRHAIPAHCRFEKLG